LARPAVTAGVSSIELRVRYAETDQMGVAHHANYLVWCEEARTAHFRRSGVSYRDLENQGLILVVVEVQVRYRAPARYDELLRFAAEVDASLMSRWHWSPWGRPGVSGDFTPSLSPVWRRSLGRPLLNG